MRRKRYRVCPILGCKHHAGLLGICHDHARQLPSWLQTVLIRLASRPLADESRSSALATAINHLHLLRAHRA